MPKASYASQKSRLLKDFDRMAARVRRVLIFRYGEEPAKALIRESRREYEVLIPQIPYIGEKSPMLIFLLPTSRYLAVYRALQKRGATVEDGGRLLYEMCEAEAKAIPGPVRRLMGWLWFSPLFLRRGQEAGSRIPAAPVSRRLCLYLHRRGRPGFRLGHRLYRVFQLQASQGTRRDGARALHLRHGQGYQ